MVVVDSLSQRAGAGWGWILIYGILSMLFGLAAFAWPFAATLAVTLIVGSFLMVTGAFSIAAGLFGKGHDGRIYAVLFGLVSVVIGMIMALEPASGAASITLLIAFWLAARGVLEVVMGMRFRWHRWWFVALGVLNLLLAIYVMVTLPWSALTLPGFILGISFVVGGFASIDQALGHRRGAPAFATPA